MYTTERSPRAASPAPNAAVGAEYRYLYQCLALTPSISTIRCSATEPANSAALPCASAVYHVPQHRSSLGRLRVNLNSLTQAFGIPGRLHKWMHVFRQRSEEELKEQRSHPDDLGLSDSTLMDCCLMVWCSRREGSLGYLYV